MHAHHMSVFHVMLLRPRAVYYSSSNSRSYSRHSSGSAANYVSDLATAVQLHTQHIIVE
jgi:hypothetical protein